MLFKGILLVLLCAELWGCSAGYQGRVHELQHAMRKNNPQAAMEVVNLELGVDNKNQRPSEVDADTPLLLLERATLAQSLGHHEAAVRDFMEADKSLEVLDLTDDTEGQLGKYLFSDDATLYKAPAHEKLLVNTMAMVSYMSLGDMESARVEGRRLNVLQKYFENAIPEELALFGLSSYIAGVAFEASGNYDEALRFYIEAYEQNQEPSILEPIAYLGDATGYEHDLVLKGRQDAPGARLLEEGEGEIVVVVQSGRAPYKVAERFPIGAFMTAGVSTRGLSPAEQKRANEAIVSGALKWINFPVLVHTDPRHASFQVSVAGEGLAEPQIDLDVSHATTRAWEEVEGTLKVAAVTRMITRAIAGEATKAVGKGANLDKNLFPGASLLLGLAVEGTLTASDTPDTRSWTTLPGQIRIYRMRLPAGTHALKLRSSQGNTRRKQVEVYDRGISVVSFRYFR